MDHWRCGDHQEADLRHFGEAEGLGSGLVSPEDEAALWARLGGILRTDRESSNGDCGCNKRHFSILKANMNVLR
jgi:hypothetical protein